MKEVDCELDLFCQVYMRLRPQLPIRHSEMAVLDILCVTPGPHTPVSLADALRVSRPMVAAHLNALQTAGLITRVSSPEDGRSVYVLPTKGGKKLYAEYHRANQQVVAELSQKIGAKKFGTMVKLIVQANEILSE